MYLGAAAVAAGPLRFVFAQACKKSGSKMKFGLVTYLWGKDWDLATLISACEKSRVLGVELRSTHAHGVEPYLNAQERKEVKKRFDDSDVVLVGLGSDERFDNPDPAKLKKAIEATKAFIKLSYDVGGSGVKVKPDSFHKGVPREKTIEQIGRSLNIVGAFGADYGQQIRLEVHGQCSELATIKAIMDIAEHPNVGVCWNCNEEDLAGEGLEYNFNLVNGRFGDTLHTRELNIGRYPYQELMGLLVKMGYAGWVLLEARTKPEDRVKALVEQREIWEGMIAKAQYAAASGRRVCGGSGVKISELEEKLRIEINGKLFTEYHFKNVPRPYFYPVIGPTGENITRHWPMKKGENEERDHQHHRSLWFTHGDVNGHDFWSEQKGFGKIVHDRFLDVTSGPDVGVIQSQNKWVTNSGEIVCTDTRTHKFYNQPKGQMMDFDITLHASHGEVTLGDTKEGSVAIRLAPTMRLKGKVGQGHIINSNGTRDWATWGKRAAWCDYYGPVKGRIVGVAIFDHPQNPKHPTWWHVRDYGLFTANPFGVHYFEKKPKGSGDITIPSGQSLTFRYRLYFHKGDEEEAKVAEYYRQYATMEPAK